MTYFMLKSQFLHRNPIFYSSEIVADEKKVKSKKRIFEWKIPEGDPYPNFLSKIFLFEKLTNNTSFDAVLCADSKYDIYMK